MHERKGPDHLGARIHVASLGRRGPSLKAPPPPPPSHSAAEPISGGRPTRITLSPISKTGTNTRARRERVWTAKRGQQRNKNTGWTTTLQESGKYEDRGATARSTTVHRSRCLCFAMFSDTRIRGRGRFKRVILECFIKEKGEEARVSARHSPSPTRKRYSDVPTTGRSHSPTAMSRCLARILGVSFLSYRHNVFTPSSHVS